MEFFDLYDAQRQPIGQIHQRGIPVPEGTYHIVAGIWTVNSKGEVLLTRRSPEKSEYPLYWENSGGSVRAGETSLQGAVRELFEETGIRAAQESLTLLGVEQERTAFIDTYIVKKDVAVTDLVLQEGETCDARWVTMEELETMIRNGEVAAPIVWRLEHLRAGFDAYRKACITK